MEVVQRTVVALLLSLSYFSSNSRTGAQFPKKEKFHAVKEDVAHVRCETCQKAIKYLYRKTNEMREKSPTRKIAEEKIIEFVEKSCHPEKDEGEWISKYDIVSADGKLRLSEQHSYGKCRQECKTIAKACEESIAEVDTDLAELLWQNKLSLSKLTNKVCHSMSSACSKNSQKLKRNKRYNEEFIPMTDEERKADQVLKQMRGMPGMPGMEMYSRDDIEKVKEQMEEQQKQQELPIDEEGLLYEGDGVSFVQMAKDCVTRFWAWIKQLFSFIYKKDEL